MNTNLSKRQFAMLKKFSDGSYMSVDTARKYDQRPFRSMLMRDWITYSPKHRSFHITDAGRDAWYEFRSTEITRQHPNRPLTSYFDPTAYRLTPRKATVHEMKHSAA